MKPSMKPETFLLASALLCTLLGLGYPLSCEVCVSDGPNCSGKLQTCAPDEDSCIVVVTETNRKGSLTVTSYKGCAKSSECGSGFFGITSNPENYMGSKRRCCQKNGCNQDPLPAFVRNHTENGLRCPSCIAAFTETCTPTEEALCVGKETRCVAVSGIVQPAGDKFAARGCGTETACHTKPGTLVPSGARLFTIKKAGCLPSPQAAGKAE
ncbi:phospholipase A2 inhibitor and Ly6/PLAUR domain-containing protein-like [Moschus berezovskii]|uniref:phospholipase A2 inhibitor and Ly6/PLAUR domain-containing protein-like n=1 Tax=Moschus berezovskii TaxID=68408 RepID=UPI0024439D08|nr:phospholipase A2 inhibitor and Ly6/PLAUR domain-containing protein-like [Moschus berezovskii]